LAPEGQVEAILGLCAGPLSHIDYHILLIEDFARNCVETIFIKAPPKNATPEDQLLLEFQGMIAKYDRVREFTIIARD
jgi:site-specific DNA recombinase